VTATPSRGEAQAIAEDFTNLMRLFGADAVRGWLRRYAPEGEWGVVADDGVTGELRVSVEAMAAVLNGVALELGFGADAPKAD
jgi:hypothetical protein